MCDALTLNSDYVWEAWCLLNEKKIQIGTNLPEQEP